MKEPKMKSWQTSYALLKCYHLDHNWSDPSFISQSLKANLLDYHDYKYSM